MKMMFTLLGVIAIFSTAHAGTPEPAPFGAVPYARQIKWAREADLFCMVNFSTITYYGKEWGYGDEDAAKFNPTQFDAKQIVRAIKAAGIKGMVIDAKHHGGFCLWPSKFNDHYTVKYCPWRNGKGDMVQELSDACRAEGIKVGIYLSPWDRNHKDYGKPEYVSYYHNQLRELLTNYGPLFEVWFDGANGGDGWYGGAKEKRKIGPDYYQWGKITKIVRELQPDAAIFEGGARDIRWVGNENGAAGTSCWATIGSNPKKLNYRLYLSQGDRNGTDWKPAEADFPQRKGWFWHPGDRSKSSEYLVDRYFATVGRNAGMDIGIAPDRRGLICDEDAAALKGFGDRIHAIFATNLASSAKLIASNVRGGDAQYAARNVLDGWSTDRYWATDDKVRTPDLVLDFGKPTTFSVISLREHIALGERVERWALDAWQNGKWKEFANGSGIGMRRLWRGEPISTGKIRLRILKAAACPAIAEFGVYLESKSIHG